MTWNEVKISQTRTRPMMPQVISLPLGPPDSPPPSPPTRSRLLRRHSSRDVTLRGAPAPAFLRLGGSPHGPLEGVSPPSGSPPPDGPQGPLMSLKRARALGPSPENMVMTPL